MIVKENFAPHKVVPYVWRELAVSIIATVVAFVTFDIAGIRLVALPFAPISIFGSALAIFLAFRSNTSYVRWWEASTLWQTIHSQSRIFGRLVVTFSDSHRHTSAYDAVRSERFQHRMILRQVGWVNALRLLLRGQDSWDELQSYLSPEEFAAMTARSDKTGFVMMMHSRSIYEAMANGTLQGFDSFQLEGALAQLTTQEGLCKRLKATPVPRQYDYFTRMFVYLFTILLPFCLLSVFAQSQIWLMIPVSVALALVFGILERTGAVNEHPFENRVTDVPISAICRNIERDLLETLGVADVPPALKPVNGYLF